MAIPGFTAESSVHRRLGSYVASSPWPRADSEVVATKSVQTIYFVPVGPFILEPSCIQLCLPWWGGHCTWICF
jgi:hypothetical protein